MGAVRGQIRKLVLLFKYLLRFIKKPLYIKKPFLGNKCHNICNANTKCKKELDLVRGKDMRAVNGTVFCFYCNVGQSRETGVIHNIWQCFRGYTKKKLWKAYLLQCWKPCLIWTYCQRCHSYYFLTEVWWNIYKYSIRGNGTT